MKNTGCCYLWWVQKCWFLSFSCRLSRLLLCLSALTPAYYRTLLLTRAHSCTFWCMNIGGRMANAKIYYALSFAQFVTPLIELFISVLACFLCSSCSSGPCYCLPGWGAWWFFSFHCCIDCTGKLGGVGLVNIFVSRLPLDSSKLTLLFGHSALLSQREAATLCHLQSGRSAHLSFIT